MQVFSEKYKDKKECDEIDHAGPIGRQVSQNEG
jgi:hypothetical protein